jgi:cell division protein FtsB
MKKVILIFVTIVLSGLLYAKDNKSTDALLREIDGIIKNHQTYGAEKEARIANLKKLLAEATSDEQRYGFCGRLFDEYRAYNLDSSFVYAQRKEELAHRMDKLDYLDDAAMNMAEVMGTTGMYKEALELLGQIDKKTLPDYLCGYYYHLYRTIYGLMGDYAVTEKAKKEYYRMTDLYRDSLLQVNVSDSLGHVLVMADKCIVHAQYDEAIRMLMEYYNKPSLDDHSEAMLTYTLSEGYRLKGDKQGQKHYLALSAIADLKSAVKEYVSLRKLASLVYDEGDIDRAYNYLKCSLEDATLCNARLRTLEISQVFPIIDQAYQLKTKRQQQEMKVSLICISLLSVFLLVAIFFVYKQMKKVAAARREVVDTNTLLQELNEELHDSNSQLKEMNHTLSEANYIKEEYIGRYMDQCSTYLDKMDLYRRSLNKIAATGRVEELYKAIKSSQFLDEELKEFYANFDVTFLQLFPNFVEEFNALLTEPMQPKPGELLNTELRIFALIRLGITDSTKIAQFLRYSVTTIYNYRTRVRNKALGERDEFEAKVMQIGKVEE